MPDLLEYGVILDGLQQFLAGRVYVPWHFGGSLMLLFCLLPDELSLFLKCQLLVLVIVLAHRLEAGLTGKVAP